MRKTFAVFSAALVLAAVMLAVMLTVLVTTSFAGEATGDEAGAAGSEVQETRELASSDEMRTLADEAMTSTTVQSVRRALRSRPTSVDTTVAPISTTAPQAPQAPQQAAVLTASSPLYEQTNRSLAYSGAWRTMRGSGFSGGSALFAYARGSSVTVSFVGTSLTWISCATPHGGLGRVTLDGRDVALVDLYGRQTQFQKPVYSTGTLANGKHTVTISWTGQKNRRSQGTYVFVDAFLIAGSLSGTTSPTTLQPTTTTVRPVTTTTTVRPVTTTTTARPITTTTTVRPITTTTTAAPATTTTVPISSQSLSVKNYGAKGDGLTDDRAAIQACINAAAAQGKEVYLPAGKYHMRPSGNIGLTVPSGVTLRGTGASSILELYDSGTDAHSILINLTSGTSRVTIRDLKLSGTVVPGTKYPSQYPSVQLIAGRSVSGLNVYNVTFDKAEYALKLPNGYSSSDLTFDGCTTTENVHNPFFTSGIDGLTIQNGTFGASRTGQQSGRWPHHFYFSTNTKNVLVSNCTLTGGQHQLSTIGGAGTGNIRFEHIRCLEVYGSWHHEGCTGGVVYDDIYMSSSRAWVSNPWFWLSNTSNVTVKNFTIIGQAGNGNWLVHGSGTNNLLQSGSVTNSAYATSTPKGCSMTGTKPRYSNVTVNGTLVNY